LSVRWFQPPRERQASRRKTIANAASGKQWLSDAQPVVRGISNGRNQYYRNTTRTGPQDDGRVVQRLRSNRWEGEGRKRWPRHRLPVSVPHSARTVSRW